MEKLIKFDTEIISHGRYVTSKMAEITAPRKLFAHIPWLIAELRLPPDLSPV